MMRFSRIHALLLILVLVMAGVLSGCGSIGSNDKGRLVFSITDAPSEVFHNVFVTIKSVEANRDGVWERIDNLDEPLKVDLLKLRLTKKLIGDKFVKAGTYSQIRLILDDSDDRSYVTLESDPKPEEEKVHYALKVPSGAQTGLKVDYQFTVSPNVVVALVMDIDGSKLPHPNAKGYIMNPTAIRTINMIEASDVSGKVVVKDTTDAITDSIVYVQATNGEETITVPAVKEGDEVGNPGEFVLHGLTAGSWEITVTALGYKDYSTTITVEEGKSQTMGTIELEKDTTTTPADPPTPGA